MRNSIAFIFFLCFGSSFLILKAQQFVKPYGGYIQVSTGNGAPGYLTRDIDVIVYFSLHSSIPDSIVYLMNGPHPCAKSGQSIICNNIVKQLYSLEGLLFPFAGGGTYITAIFKNSDSTRYIGKNWDTINTGFLLTSGLYVDYGLKPRQDKSVFLKDNPLVIIKKGKTTLVNFADSVLNNIDDLHFEFGESYLNVPPIPNGVSLNPKTGDIFIDGGILDTGYYTILLNAEENYPGDESRTWYNFTILSKPIQ